MSAAEILTCRQCGAAMQCRDGRYACPQCDTEVYLDQVGEEVWSVHALVLSMPEAVEA